VTIPIIRKFYENDSENLLRLNHVTSQTWERRSCLAISTLQLIVFSICKRTPSHSTPSASTWFLQINPSTKTSNLTVSGFFTSSRRNRGLQIPVPLVQYFCWDQTTWKRIKKNQHQQQHARFHLQLRHIH